MPLPSKSLESEEWGTPTNNLWVGNLPPEVTDSDIMELFAPFGALDTLISYSSRTFAFVFLRRLEDAKAAKTTLQGAFLRGIHIRIEFARPPKPCKQLWVGGVSPSITKEELETEFRRFGKIEDFKLFRDRNTACVEFLNLDDATRAVKIMNGKRLGGDQICVDFLRSQSTKRDLLVDYGQFQARPQHSQPPIGRNGQPSNVLWIGFPPSFQIDEQMLHNAMILFGEIERIKSFPSRHYSFVEFRSVDEARRAKEGLQGRLFNDPRITIMYSSSEMAPGKDYPGIYPGSKGTISDGLVNEHPLRPLQIDAFGHNRPIVPNNFPGQLPPGGVVGPNAPMRSFGSQGLEPLISGPEFNEMGTHTKFQDGSSKSLTGPNWKRPSPPASGMLPSPMPGIQPPSRSTSGAWDVLDINQVQRDSKRSRIDGALHIGDTPFPLRNIDDRGLGLEQTFAIDPVIDGVGSGPKSHLGAVGSRITSGVPGSVQPDIDHIWRGIIAKGGTPVCRARCVPIGKGIGTDLPDVVDCAARTGLDMLTKHYADAIGFDVVFFLPDSEEDFASYTEFLRYLKAKNRAGVAKFVDNTTLFLVPPSDFLTNVLKVTGPERLYGVVLKFPSVPSSTPMQQAMHLPSPSTQYMQQIPPSQADYGSISVKEEQVLPMDYNRLIHEDSKLLPKPLHPATNGPSSIHSVPPDYTPTKTVSASQTGVTLTPELIATLTSLLPATTQSSATDGAKTAVGPSAVKPPFPPGAPNDGNQSHLWKQDHHIADPPNHPPQQFGSMYNIPNAQYQPYPPAFTPDHSAQVVYGGSHFQDSGSSLQQLGTVSSTPMNNFIIPPQNGQVAASPQVSQPYQVEVSHNTQKGFGMVQGTDASVLSSSKAFQQPNFIPSSNQISSAASQQQNLTPYPVDNVNTEPPNQQLQPALFGVGQAMSELEADKNQRYQSTLQFAANLLFQIQQQQTQGGHGPGNHQ
ncbi:flowering time control protein FPA-like [Abrus precatorius]|uniref:Flowering time control protein FPA-like n=1 Tax=Abrus precatorius TaxID=3816 RepID=A0A8B8K9I2_ABRPR|nr:flowering time control protein FPA-like [Abrus precatorius]XP_027339828.1 flowering time control protein FPA-like [Abrus precatorius]